MVGGATWLAVPGLSLAAAFTLGAILGPTDAVTTASIGRQLHLPRRLLTVITGESMLNDGTALTVYAVAVSAAATTVATPSPLEDVRSLLFIGAGGVAVGLVLGVLIHRIRLRLRDPLVESALSLLAPFTAYLAADSLHVSGILSVVVAGLYLGHHAGQAHFATRLQDMAVWRVATFLLESVAFALIGLQLRPVLQDLGRGRPGTAGRRGGHRARRGHRGPDRLGVPVRLPAPVAGAPDPEERTRRRAGQPPWCCPGPACAASSRWPRRPRCPPRYRSAACWSS